MRIATRQIVFAAAAGSVLLMAGVPAWGQWSSPSMGSPYGSNLRPGAPDPRGISRDPLTKPAEKTKVDEDDDPAPRNVPLMPGDIPVVEVRIVGNQVFKKEQILRHIQTRAGRPYNEMQIARDVRQLNKTGMFSYIKPSTQATGGGYIVIFNVIERPTLTDVIFVRKKSGGGFENLFTSEKRQEEKLRKEADLKPGDPADPYRVEEARRAIEEHYHQKGYTLARVTIHEGDKPEDRRAVFIINEGPKYKIAWTQFVGNTIATDGRLRTLIESKPGILWTFKGEFDKKKIEADKDALVAYYRGLGFFHARVGHEVSYSPVPYFWSEPSPVVTFIIDEGPRWKIRDVSFIGNSKIDTAKLNETIKLAPGEYFKQDSMTADIRKMREEYGSMGYIFTEVKAEPRFHEEPGELDLVYSITEGDRYRVGRILPNIGGESPHTKVTVLLNQTSLHPGDIIDVREVRASERRYQFSQVFSTEMGRGPKIVFSPDDATNLEEEPAQMARPPQGPGGFRGQSPDDMGDRLPIVPSLRPEPFESWFAPRGPRESWPLLQDGGTR
ncbi:MAG: hypothetical protein GX621_15865 [Pirellulaceae bacterium]|nr:hypothetical protein [Pirellulaceae bacterium]